MITGLLCLFSHFTALPPVHIRYLALHLRLAVMCSFQFPSLGLCSFPSLHIFICYSIPSISSLFLPYPCSSFHMIITINLMFITNVYCVPVCMHACMSEQVLSSLHLVEKIFFWGGE